MWFPVNKFPQFVLSLDKTTLMLFGIISLILASISIILVIILLISNSKQRRILKKELKIFKEFKDKS